ncbi:non-ribosomal peptide synthase protein (TIGR01720 family)/amino acid adenylation domain-containing protein/natural product biosynthesis luciferase-like monooxygenase protein [Archangium gephyra]|uniref:Phenolphthiocerol/phthiocerol polyketide synthase subunit E n=1 Tax=Archangium gephyra TaxID=48 RepID=A0AAC8TFV7_9BACT|nr:hybrid non-ribosomal peptide synthetase/type I polyketide synthase [Archangium gephyra]AKJ04230.1 Malonyl CoA-acyl carrier protein transacylase [Archangium gephyra]REG37690.1 non-ribosomal peptide synthase protein (TIGR01720 family)/amino acid adenylation domain-containing protein/natural product biosynthesis luciferase-like monooxygenase protein [Archangium gephyra]
MADNDIAIIGMAGRFPGAADLHAFWKNLREGVESISRFQAEELEPSPLVPEALRAHPDFVRAGGVLEGADLFDHGFFDIAPREALWMDPQQRVFLECAWAALEDAAYDPERFPGKISLYAGAGQSGHVLSLLGHVKKDPASLFEALGTTNAENVATKASFKLRLRGESLALYTACSTGLVAVHMACQSLLLRQSDIALAGAVRISLPQRTGYLYQDGMIFSPDGHCRAFDARARGTVSGNGVGVVVLKPLADALRDGDHVYAVIKGSAINNDGHQKVGYTAPSVEGQAEAISEALAYAGVGAGELDYVEAHGTGTPLGDPIELSALTRAFRRDTEARGYCAIGSVKTNIGHLDTAAGIAGLLKATLALHHEELPASLHFERPNPAIDFAGSPFFVASERRPWARGEKPRLAGVSSFGIGGTNAHAILGEAPLTESRPSARPRQLVTLSARTATALDAMTHELAAWLEARPGVDLADLAFTRNVGRKAFEHRRTLVAADVPSLLGRLKAPPAAQAIPSLEAAREQRVAFLFPGQGAQSVGMARELYAAEPGFREHVDACLALLTPRLGRPLHPLLYPAPAQEAEAREALADPRYALPLLFTVEYALARLWMDWGVEPRALFGHSYGEYVAACLAGVLTLEDALALAVVRGQLMARMPPGAMTAAGCSEAELQPLLTGALSLASINGASRCVVSGPVDEVERLEQELARRGVGSLRLPARQAFHSAAVEPLREELQRTVAGLRLSAPQRPYISSLTGTWIRPEEATDPSYWARQMRQPVRFAEGLDTLQRDGCAVFLEVGPDQALTTLARMHLRGSEPVRVVPSLPRSGVSASDHGALLEAVGALWQAGLEVSWERFYAHEQRQRLSLPSYPFERQLFRLEPRWMEMDVAPAPVPVMAPVTAPVAAPISVVAPAGKEGPRTDVERQVMAIWRERLGVEDFGIHDNFLELGGNSLMAAQMLTRLRESFPVQIPLSDLFEAPTVAGVAGRIEARLKEVEGSGTGVPVPRLVPVTREGELPLSFVQERVCALERFSPGNPALHMSVALRLTGSLDVAVLERGLAEIVRRHEVLRVTYAFVDGRFVPRVHSEMKTPLQVVVLEGSREQREAEALRLAQEDIERPFSLEQGPVLRASLARIAPDSHLLFVTVHHVISDTLSMVAIARELAVNYEAFLQGRPSPLPALSVQYMDFAAWQRRTLESGAFPAQVAYWRERMAAPPGPLALPTDRPRGASSPLRSARRLFGLSRRLSDAILALGQREGFTSFMILLAGYKALLARYAGQEDIVVGTPIGNRSRGELEPLIGYVAHAVPLRTDLSGDPSFRELIGRVRDTTLGAHANPDVPYEHLVRELEPKKDSGTSRLFDALFVLHHAGFGSHVELPGLRLEHVQVEAPSQFGSLLSSHCLALGESEQGFSGDMEYATELFDAATIERMIGHFEALLASAVENPDLRLSELSLETREERSQREALAAPAPRGEIISIAALLEAQASKAPEAPAVTAGARSLSWGELRERARHLAGALVHKGVGPEQLVAVCLEPSPERLVAQWAVLEAGGAWVLVPPSRLRELASLAPEGAPVPLLLTDSRLRTSVPLDASRVLYVDTSLEGVPALEHRAAPAGAEAMVCLEALGVTEATPRRAIHTPRTVAHLFRALDEGQGGTSGGAWLWAEEAAGQGSGLEVLWALCRGLRVVLPREPASARFVVGRDSAPRRPLAFSLSYFANDEDTLGRRKYQLLLDGARFADSHGFSAIWTPERHFHSFGGLYPSPAITGAGIATLTENVGIRAGSVVLPLHDPLQVAEEWAMIDNLSGGRVGVSFASGWHANDFVFAPDNYARRKELMHRGIETVRHLWRGGTVRRRNGDGHEVEISIRPRPVQAELPFWLTAAGSPETFRLAGELGANVLTNLMGQQLDSLAEKVALYRETWRRHGHGPGRGHVSLMMHAFLGTEVSEVRRTVREPLMRYFRGSVDISSGFIASQGLNVDPRSLSPRDMEAMLEHGFERHLEDGGLFGTPESCEAMIERVRRLDVDEVACLVDFGTSVEETMTSLQHLDTLRRRSQPQGTGAVSSVWAESGAEVESVLALVRETGATYLHCTPSLARALATLPRVSEALRSVRRLFVEGAAPELAASLARAAGVEVLRREEAFGPAAWLPVRAEEKGTPVFLPPAHLHVQVLDSRGMPVPVGVSGVLAIGGEGVPRGFWKEPPLEAGARLLPMGQRARRRADGSVELLAGGAPAARRPAPAPVQAPRPEVARPEAARRAEGPPSIARVPRDRPLPLSFSQQRLWYLDQLEPGNVAYNNPSALRLSGPLNAAALERALNEVVRRHEALRTTFALEDSGPVQRIAEALSVPLPVVRLEAEGDRDAAIVEWAREEARRPFELAAGPLIRAALLRIEDTEHVLLVTPHHIVSDGWSAGVMLKELAVLYAAFVSGAASPLPELPVQYVDYAAWQHEWLRGPTLEKELSWWKQTLADVPVLRLSTDKPRPAVQSYRGAQHRFTVPRSVSEALGALAKREGATPFMVLMAAYQLLLSRYSGQEDFAVGTAVAGRSRPELEPLVGCFINSLPLRADLSGDPSFVELLGRVRRTALEGFAHQEVPFEKLVDALHVSRDLGHSPIFQTLLVLHNVPMPTVKLAGLTLSGMDLHVGAAKLDLALELRETPDGLWGGLEYNTDLFDAETIARLGGHFLRLLEGIAAAPEHRLSALTLLSEAERRQLLVEWNPPHVPASSATVLELFEAQVARTPDAPAVADAGEVLSYRELAARAWRIASLLRRQGVGSECVVALAMERPTDVVSSILGTLAAGGAWLPLDLSSPPERLRLVLEDAGARVVLTREAMTGRFAGAGRTVLAVESAASEPSVPLTSRPEPHHAAYVLFTSGSTGKPKGVVVEHRQLAHATRARFEVYGTPGVCVPLSPFTFDASLAGLFWTLLHGGTLRFPDSGVMDDPRELAASLARHGVTHLIGVPVLYAQILAAAPAGGLSSLRAVTVGGEACPRDLVRAHHEALPGTALFNEYGPTEATIWSTVHKVDPSDLGPVPIGRAIPGARVYVLSERLQPVPVGVPGELYVGGAGVARGYLGRPELTSERFVADPFDTSPGARLYRTGDRVRWRKDGVLEFLGRQDGQVKVRGFRIETGEVEVALAAHSGLREVAVAAREDGRGGRRLVGYVVPHQRPGPTPDALRAFLRERLPEYMVPSAFVERESLPRTRNGKVDLGALPAPELQTAVRSAAYVAPRNELETQLARIWCEVLGVERVGVDDNFFELGGDSILSIQIVTRAGRAGIELSPRQVFQNPTVARLAAVANTRLAVQAEQGPVTGPVALSPIQRWFFAQSPAEPHHWNMSLFLEVRTALDAALLERTLGLVVEHHDALRLRFARTEAGWRQVCAPPGEPVRLERVDLSGVAPEARTAELERRATEAQSSLRLEEGPLLRAVLFDLGSGQSGRLLLVLHHLLVDGVSWRILLEDLLGTYQRLAAGAPVALPPKTTSFQAWAHGLSEHARSGKLDAERSWWLARPWARVTRLPVDSPGGENLEGTARGVSLSLTAEETRALLQDVPKAYHSQINDALLTALARTVGRWSGNPLVLVDVEGHGREELLAGLDVSRTVGWFTTFFPALLEARQAAGPGETLRDVKESLRAVPSKGMGYGLLRHLAEDAGLAGLPRAELSFNYLGQVDGALNGNGMLALAPEGMGPQRGPRTRRPYLLDVVGAVVGGRLQMTWTYGESIHRRETVEKLAADFLERLRELIAHCQSPEAGGHTPSDFPMAKVKQSQLDKLSARFGKKTQ